MKGASMFSSAGIAETYFKKAGLEIVVANEILEKRGKFYQEMYPKSKMIIGDIRDDNIKKEFISHISKEVEFLIATPPCQGVSTLGANKKQKHFEIDKRNYLIFDTFDVIDNFDFNYILIENVPRFLKMYFPYDGRLCLLEEILNKKYGHKYIIDIKILNAKDYGVPQSRPRAIIKMYKFGLKWNWPKPENEITLRDAISHLPSLESGEKSNLRYHYAKNHNLREILCMKYTSTGQSAISNKCYYPKKENGDRISGFHNTYKRMNWDLPAPARTMNNGNIGSHNNVHPGRKKEDGTYSDARVLTLRELFIVSSLPEEWEYPCTYSDSFIRTIIGEAIPPKFSYNIVKGIKSEKL